MTSDQNAAGRPMSMLTRFFSFEESDFQDGGDPFDRFPMDPLLAQQIYELDGGMPDDLEVIDRAVNRAVRRIGAEAFGNPSHSERAPDVDQGMRNGFGKPGDGKLLHYEDAAMYYVRPCEVAAICERESDPERVVAIAQEFANVRFAKNEAVSWMRHGLEVIKRHIVDKLLIGAVLPDEVRAIVEEVSGV